MDGQFHLSDMGVVASSLLKMPKDVVDGKYDYDWPGSGEQLRIELESEMNRSIRFFLDVHEARRRSSVALAVNDLRERKSKMQTRASYRVIARVDYTSRPESMLHTNPDGTMIEGSHVHFWVDGYGGTIAIPLGGQDIIVPENGVVSANTLLMALMDASEITRKLMIRARLEGV